MTKTKLLLWALVVVIVMTIGAVVGNYVTAAYRHLDADHKELHALSKWAVGEIQKQRQTNKPATTTPPTEPAK